jgi:hypothetical protein
MPQLRFNVGRVWRPPMHLQELAEDEDTLATGLLGLALSAARLGPGNDS